MNEKDRLVELINNRRAMDDCFILQYKERRLVKGCYAPDELPWISDTWCDYILSPRFWKLKEMVDRSTYREDYRIVSRNTREVLYRGIDFKSLTKKTVAEASTKKKEVRSHGRQKCQKSL